MAIKFGPGGLGGVKEAVSNLHKFAEAGLKACEIEFTYGVYIKEGKEAEEIGETAKKLGIELSIHAPYYINLNSEDKSKIEASKKRILDCCKIGNIMGVKYVVFHPGYILGSREESYENIKREIIEMQKTIKEKEWKIKLAPETAGKLSVFGSVDEILKLVKETNCWFTVDFAHLKARTQGKVSYEKLYAPFKHFNELHVHFSGIEWTDKGEKNHKITEEKEIKKLLDVLPKSKDIVIINESPEPFEDSVKSVKIYEKL